jgi:hypothetical protein
MRKLKAQLIAKCNELRLRGHSLSEISSILNIPKTTVYGHVRNITLTPKQQKEIKIRQIEKCRNKPNLRKGKCLAGREIIRPKSWSKDLVHIVAHFMFDGRVTRDSCIYYNSNRYQIIHMRNMVHKIFKVKPKIKLRDNGVYGLLFYHIELAHYIKSQKEAIFDYLRNGACKLEKRIFLQSFFDDEGNVYYKNDKRRVRGYQNSSIILEVIKDLLNNFGIKSRINKKCTEIEISGKKNLLKFAQKINFSPRIYINSSRKNGIWKREISKRKILDLLLRSYRK